MLNFFQSLFSLACRVSCILVANRTRPRIVENFYKFHFRARALPGFRILEKTCIILFDDARGRNERADSHSSSFSTTHLFRAKFFPSSFFELAHCRVLESWKKELAYFLVNARGGRSERAAIQPPTCYVSNFSKVHFWSSRIAPELAAKIFTSTSIARARISERTIFSGKFYTSPSRPNADQNYGITKNVDRAACTRAHCV